MRQPGDKQGTNKHTNKANFASDIKKKTKAVRRRTLIEKLSLVILRCMFLTLSAWNVDTP